MMINNGDNQENQKRRNRMTGFLIQLNATTFMGVVNGEMKVIFTDAPQWKALFNENGYKRTAMGQNQNHGTNIKTHQGDKNQG